MKLISDNVFKEIKLTNRERKDFNKINKLKEKILTFIIFILIIALFLLIYFLKLKNKDIRDILFNSNKYKKYSTNKLKKFKESINKLNEIKNNMRIYTSNLIKKKVELKHNLKKANSYNDNLLKQKPLFVK